MLSLRSTITILSAITLLTLGAKEKFYSAEGNDLGFRHATPLMITAAQEIRVNCGTPVTFTVNPVKPPQGATAIRITRMINGLPEKESTHKVEKFTITMSLDRPGHLSVSGIYLDKDDKPLKTPPRVAPYADGVLVEPEKIEPFRPIPKDFKAFWERQKALLRAIPMKVTRKQVKTDELCRYEDVEISSIAGIPVTGYLTMPVKSAPKTLPAVLYFHGAGFRSSSFHKAFGQNAIVFDVNAHGLPNGKSREYYKALNKKPPLDRRIFSNANDPEKSYIKNMFLRTVRALDFVRSMPEWDGKTLIVSGRSQGGAQSVAAAALGDGVTLCIANVPALAGHAGASKGFLPGWPILNRTNDPAIDAAADYFDVINLASLIRCQTIMSIGMADSICPPVTIYLAYKNISSRKQLNYFPAMGHNAPPHQNDGRKIIKRKISK